MEILSKIIELYNLKEDYTENIHSDLYRLSRGYTSTFPISTIISRESFYKLLDDNISHILFQLNFFQQKKEALNKFNNNCIVYILFNLPLWNTLHHFIYVINWCNVNMIINMAGNCPDKTYITKILSLINPKIKFSESSIYNIINIAPNDEAFCYAVINIASRGQHIERRRYLEAINTHFKFCVFSFGFNFHYTQPHLENEIDSEVAKAKKTGRNSVICNLLSNEKWQDTKRGSWIYACIALGQPCTVIN